MPRPKGSLNKNQRECKLIGCNKKHYGYGFCRLHYSRQPKVVESRKQYRKRPGHIEKQYRRKMKSVYGLDPSKYDKIFKNQNGKCALCNKRQSELTVRLNIDHDHITNKIRGLICNKCNLEVGYYEIFQNNPEKSKKIKKYLYENFISS